MIASAADAPHGMPTLVRRTSSERVGWLRDGTRVRVRAVRPEDWDQIVEFLTRVSTESLERRFFSPVRPGYVVLEILAPIVHDDRLSLIVEVTDRSPGLVIAHGEYDRRPSDPTRAEVAFLVADDRSGQGVATILLVELARRARAVGVRWFDAVVLPENRSMTDVFLGAGFPCTFRWAGGVGRMSMDISREPSIEIVPVPGPGSTLAQRLAL